MGFFDRTVEFMSKVNYENSKMDLPPQVRRVIERAMILQEAGRLDARKLLELAEGSPELLQYLSRSSVQMPGSIANTQAIKRLATEAAVIAVDESLGRVSPPGWRVEAIDSQVAADNMISFLLQAEWEDNGLLEHPEDEDKYFQFGVRPYFVRMELSGDVEFGGTARFTPKERELILYMGWNLPRPGLDDYPNYWVEEAWDRDEGRTVPPAVAWSCAHLARRTLDGVLGWRSN